MIIPETQSLPNERGRSTAELLSDTRTAYAPGNQTTSTILVAHSSSKVSRMTLRQTLLHMLFLWICSEPAAAADPRPVQVYLLAGQSNMEGQGVVDLDHPQYYNSGKGTLQKLAETPALKERYQHVRDSDGNWTVRDDVWCRYRTARELKRGPLSIGFAVYEGRHHIGPEFQFGHVIGDSSEAPVLLIKTAWGGKSLFADFRPPSSGGETGPYYKQMLDEIREALAAIPDEFPALADRPVQISGFVWFQGWNDAFGPQTAREEYEQNLVNLILDVRREFDVPELPVVIGELGNDGDQANDQIKAIRRAQAAAAARKELGNHVAFVPTTAFARPANQSPNVTHGHHWYGNAESYFLVGDALGKAMLKLQTAARRAR